MITIKKMETDDEIRGKAFVHYTAWQEAYRGIVDQRYLDAMTPEKCLLAAQKWRDNILVALDGGRVVGFAGYGACRDGDLIDAGEVFALYTLSEYFGKGVGKALMDAALTALCRPTVAVWVLCGNARAIAFYSKYGFRADGKEQTLTLGEPVRVQRMILER